MAQPLHVLAVLATAQIVHAYPGMLSSSRSITAGSTIMGHTVQQSSSGSARLGSVACGGSLTAGATMTMSLSGYSGQYIMEATGKRCSANSMCTYTVPSSGSVTVRGVWATGSSSGVYVSPDCTYTVQAAVSCNTCEDGKYLSGCGGGSSGSCKPCAGCQAGQYRTGCSGTSAGECTSCGAGKYKTSSGSEACSECTTCPAGKVSSGCGGSLEGECTTSSVECEPGQYASGSTCTPCGGCEAGKYRSACSGTSGGTCETCGAGQYKTAAGSGACKACADSSCPAGQTRSGCGGSSEGTCVQSSVSSDGTSDDTTAAATSSSTAVAVEVSMAVELPYTKASFESNKDTFREGVAAASMVTVDKVKINSVVEKTGSRRRLLASGVVVDFSVAASTSGAASVLVSRLTLSSINQELSARGLEQITAVTKAPALPASSAGQTTSEEASPGGTATQPAPGVGQSRASAGVSAWTTMVGMAVVSAVISLY